VYERKAADEVSWYEERPARSLELVRECALEPDSPVLDVGGGMSGLAVALVGDGFTDVTVADISASALRLGEQKAAERELPIRFVLADVRTYDFGRSFAVWHDRAVFHFMVTPDDRAAYLEGLRRTLRPDGHLLIATFGPDGPEQCSGLPTARYDASALAGLLGDEFGMKSSGIEVHQTPSGASQQFMYAHFQRASRR
jgi:SAM-dependent methyltransferase